MKFLSLTKGIWHWCSFSPRGEGEVENPVEGGNEGESVFVVVAFMRPGALGWGNSELRVMGNQVVCSRRLQPAKRKG